MVPITHYTCRLLRHSVVITPNAVYPWPRFIYSEVLVLLFNIQELVSGMQGLLIYSISRVRAYIFLSLSSIRLQKKDFLLLVIYQALVVIGGRAGIEPAQKARFTTASRSDGHPSFYHRPYSFLY